MAATMEIAVSREPLSATTMPPLPGLPARAGKTIAENLAECAPLVEGQTIVSTFDKPVKPTGHIAILQARAQVLCEFVGGRHDLFLVRAPHPPTYYYYLLARMSAYCLLQGNLAPEFAVGKITGKEGTRFSGPARCFDQEEDMMAAVASDAPSFKGCVIVIRYAGPRAARRPRSRSR